MLHKPLEHLNAQEKDAKPTFQMPRVSSEGRVACNPSKLNEIFHPDSFIDRIVTSTHAYARKKLPPSQYEAVPRAEILQFFANYYYSGMVWPPSKED